MSFYYNSLTGDIFQQTGAAKWATDREIWLLNHDPIPGTDLYGPFATEMEAEAAKKAHPPADFTFSGLNPVNAVKGAIGDVGAWVVRGVEIVVGVVLLAIAANVILKQTTGVDVAAKARAGAGEAAKLAAV